jgi:8-hydroxy-5-deazaflavin:NADPH oxidoreductase
MKIGIIGTGIVGQTLASKLAALGHEVLLGTRNVAATIAKTAPGNFGQPPLKDWLAQHPTVKLATFAATAAHGELLVNAASGAASLEILREAGADNLKGKILLDISNPLDFSKGMPPTLTVCNTDSLGEQIQRAFPETKVIKTLNTMNAYLMVDANLVANGDHHIFVSGNDVAAKGQAIEFLKSWFGWKHVLDLGDISTARGTEMFLPLWVRMYGALKTGMFNIKIAQ